MNSKNRGKINPGLLCSPLKEEGAKGRGLHFNGRPLPQPFGLAANHAASWHPFAVA